MLIRKMTSSLALLGLLFVSRDLTAAGKSKPLLSDVRVSPPTFLPSLGQSVQLTAGVAAAGTFTLEVLDRDGFVIRTLAARKPIKAGHLSLAWDGKDDAGEVVPDEAYSFRLALSTTEGTALYFPANEVPEMYEVPPAYYSRADGTLVYALPKASRVHLQAGEAVRDPATKAMSGPVLKTIVNREPRPAGRVVEHWNGRDESGTLLVPELPHFVVGIACWPLPENSVIATGNRKTTFLTHVAARTGKSRINVVPSRRHHHAGLMTLEDVSPNVAIIVRNGTRTDAGGCWQVSTGTVTLAVDVTGPTAERFRVQPGRVSVFDGVTELARRAAAAGRNELDVKLPWPMKGRTSLAVNWASDYGPTAPGVVCIEPRDEPVITEREQQQ